MPKLRNKIALLYRYLIIATKRLTDKQLMILLAIVVGLAAALARLLNGAMFFRFVLTSWFDIDTASVFYPVLSGHRNHHRHTVRQYVVRDNISEGGDPRTVTR